MLTKREKLITALTLIKKGAAINWNIDKDVISLYGYALRKYPDDIIMSVCKELAITWKNRYPPQPGVIKELCQISVQGVKTGISAEQKEMDINEHRAYMTRKFRHRHALKEITDKIKTNTGLTDKQLEDFRVVSGYMVIWGDDWVTKLDYQDEKQKLSPITASFVGLYMDALEGILKPLTGKKQGNLTFDLGG